MGGDLLEAGFADRAELRAWLQQHHARSPGLLVRVPKGRAGGLTFEDLLDEGLCFGWSESTRLPGGPGHFLQRFTPRRRPGTTSARNLAHARRLVAEGRMTPAGLAALALPPTWPEGEAP